MAIATFVVAAVLLAVVGLLALHASDARRANGLWSRLAAAADDRPAFFEASMVAQLPEPARRYFRFTIEPGAPLRTVVEIRLRGALGLGDRSRPRYGPMRARQILAPPHGLVWKLRFASGAVRVSGSDGADGRDSWTRFWLLGVLPIVRRGGNRDHARSAFGRVVAESAIWVPAALLPARGATWEALGDDAARATLCVGDWKQSVDVTVGEDGRPLRVVIERWSDANPERRYRFQPFGGYLSAFRSFDGYRLPTRVEGGNRIGTPDYFPFYKVEVERLRFIGGA